MPRRRTKDKARLIVKREHRLAKALAERRVRFPVSKTESVNSQVAERVLRCLKAKINAAMKEE